MFDTKFYKNRCRPLNFRRIWFLYIFFIVTSNYKNSMYPRSFLCEEAKIKQRTPLKKELCKIGKEAIWGSRFTSFFFLHRSWRCTSVHVCGTFSWIRACTRVVWCKFGKFIIVDVTIHLVTLLSKSLTFFELPQDKSQPRVTFCSRLTVI